MHAPCTGRPLPSELVRQHHIIALARQPWTFRIGHEHVFVGVDFGGFLEAISGRIPLGDVEVAVGAEGNDGFVRGVHGHAYGLVPVGIGGDFDGFSGGEKNELLGVEAGRQCHEGKAQSDENVIWIHSEYRV